MKYIFRDFTLLFLWVVFFCTTKTWSELVGPQLISQDEMPRTLSLDGQIYALSGDLAGNLTITGNDITVNLNKRTITGRIIISGQRALVYGGNIIAPAPTNFATADAGVVEIDASANNAQIIDCYISAADTTASSSSRGARGMEIDAPNVIIRNCYVAAGNDVGANSVDAGGIGIQITSDHCLIDNCQIYGGDGAPSSIAGNFVGSGGIGLNVTAGINIRCLGTVIQAGNAGQAAGASAIGLFNGGDGVDLGIDVTISFEDCEITGGNSPIIFGDPVAEAAQGNGGIGINSSALNLTVQECTIRGGDVGSTTATGLSGLAIFNGGFDGLNGGRGGAAIYLNTDSVKSVIQDSVIRGGDSGLITATNAGGIGINTVNQGVDSGRGGHGIEIVQQVINGVNPSALIQNCDITGGQGLDIVSAALLGTFVKGNAAGHGIALTATNVPFVDIIDCTIRTLNGGNLSGASYAAGSVGGNGGDGIHLADITGDAIGINSIYISHNQLLAIGQGGNAPGAGDTGGNGGYGIFIGPNLVSAEVGNNKISFSPGGGSGGLASGNDNKAILESPLASAVIYGNFAYKITRTPGTFPYSFILGDAVDAPNGTLFTSPSGTNYLLNIYKP